MTTKKLLLALSFVALCCAVSWAVTPETPVRWRSFIKFSPEGNPSVVFRALVTPGWHLYGLDIPEGGPKATSFDFEGSTDIEFTGAVVPSRKPIQVDDPLFGMTLTWWDSKVEFVVPFKVTGDNPIIKCKISFMACDGTSCRPPSTETIVIPVNKDK